MKDASTDLGRQIDTAMKLLSLSAKVGLLVGGGSIVGYLLMNGHYPQGVSLGDGLLFLVSAFSFGIVCLYFSISITAVGILLSPILAPAVRLAVRVVNVFREQKIASPVTRQKIGFPAVFFGFCGLAIIYFLARRSLIDHLPLIVLPLFQCIMYAALVEQNEKMRLAKLQAEPDPQENQPSPDLHHLRKSRAILAGIILVVPILMGGVTSDLLQLAMTFAKIRIDHATILVKAPYSNLLPNPKESKIDNFKTFEKATVIFRGVGNTTLIEMRTPDTATRLEIPNDSIIIERTAKIAPDAKIAEGNL
ncbi:hypothetical protein KVG96_11100 [Pseudomonas sp. COR58]|uniref:Uncharacterized protein n=1 Tax=Pseudomonas ekonensis TaxID=2842353 RepID=A0ABS6PDF8_9PSED|nr:hypothetical protein [Pseudomonas ekonensis]MBV4458500.1 hypothetical protein [Pseudomonas ekonensis]